ncbi:hypothetical protein L2E82_39679 [Cichorium intybus]|uniref:Uncharacterized protein n=1 Tax=Cichorium intybus TaxID=13427 RepID=A0ACB9AIV9_CICIN|nr:hypothetical protein L2E82_39679 [Cichorium intybus]
MQFRTCFCVVLFSRERKTETHTYTQFSPLTPPLFLYLKARNFLSLSSDHGDDVPVESVADSHAILILVSSSCSSSDTLYSLLRFSFYFDLFPEVIHHATFFTAFWLWTFKDNTNEFFKSGWK